MTHEPLIESTAVVFHEIQTGDYSKELSVITHPIHYDRKGQPMLGAGRVFSTSDKQRLADSLGRNLTRDVEFMDTQCLAGGAETLMWFSPRKGKRELCVIDEYLQVPLPSLVFLLHKGQLFVKAYKGDKRPDPKTRLYDAPLPNLYADASWCDGGNRLPGFPAQSDIERIERMFFESPFTGMHHTNIGGFTQMQPYFRSLAKKKVFPTSTLRGNDQALGQFLKRSSAR